MQICKSFHLGIIENSKIDRKECLKVHNSEFAFVEKDFLRFAKVVLGLNLTIIKVLTLI